LTSDIPLADQHAILNTYIIIEIAIISVGFVGTSLKQNGMKQETYNNVVALVVFSTFVLCFDVLAYFASFLKPTNTFDSNFVLAIITLFTFITLFFMLAVFLEFMPDIEDESNEQSGLE
jgi:hypothetical protein